MNLLRGVSNARALVGRLGQFSIHHWNRWPIGATLWLAITAWTVPTFALDWQADLDDGRRISVDLDSNRVQVVGGKGQGTPLWDGVHRLQDGSVITVRSGLMVPNREVLTTRAAPPHQPPSVTESACSQLIDKACGADSACGDTQACDLARQLRAIQRNRTTSDQATNDWAVTRCRQGLADDTVFARCDVLPTADPDVCLRLVDRLCGATNRCAASEACEIARQMLDLERDAQRDGAAEYVLDSRLECQSVFREHAYFPPCR